MREVARKHYVRNILPKVHAIMPSVCSYQSNKLRKKFREVIRFIKEKIWLDYGQLTDEHQTKQLSTRSALVWGIPLPLTSKTGSTYKTRTE